MKHVPILLACICTFGCQKYVEPSEGQVSDPVNELEWLKEATTKIKEDQRCETGICCGMGVWQASFIGKTVFIIGVNNEVNLGNIICDGVYPIYSLNGDSLGLLGYKNILEVQNKTLIWSSR